MQESKSRALPFGYSAMRIKKNAFLIRSVKRELSPSRLATHGRPVAAIATEVYWWALAETARFELAVAYRHGGLANRCYRPLSHVSITECSSFGFRNPFALHHGVLSLWTVRRCSPSCHSCYRSVIRPALPKETTEGSDPVSRANGFQKTL